MLGGLFDLLDRFFGVRNDDPVELVCERMDLEAKQQDRGLTDSEQQRLDEINEILDNEGE